MPSKKPLPKKAPKVEFLGYLNVNLTPDQDAEFDKLFTNDADWIGDLVLTVEHGYKVSFAEDEYNDGIVCSMYAKSAKLPWAGWTLTAWAGSHAEAAALLLFKHIWVCERDWEKFRGTPSRTHSKRG